MFNKKIKSGFAIALLMVFSVFAFALASNNAFAASTTYTYDSLNRISTAAYPDGTTITYSYNATGTLISKTVVSMNSIGYYNPTSVTLTSAGATYPLAVFAAYSDGSKKNVTASASYSSSNSSVATVSSGGLIP